MTVQALGCSEVVDAAREGPRRPQGGGRRRVDDRAVLAAIVYVAQAGCSWWKLPVELLGVTPGDGAWQVLTVEHGRVVVAAA
jgi:hypothetical protein